MQTSFDLLALLRQPEKKQFFDRFSKIKYSAGTTLRSDGAERDGVFFVLSGMLRVYLSYEGKEFSLFFLNPGDIFATHSDAIVEAREDTEILFITRHQFRDIVIQVPEIALGCIALVGRFFGDIMETLQAVAFRDVRYRVAGLLLDLAEKKGKASEKGVVVELDFNIEELSTIVCATRQSTSYILNELFRKGAVERVDRTHLLIRQIDLLRDLRD